MINTVRGVRVHSSWLKRSGDNRIVCQLFSSFQNAVLDSKQGDKLLIHCKVPSIVIDVTSAWQEHCDMKYSKDLKFDMTAGESDSRTFTISMCNSSGMSDDTPTLKVTVPEIFNISMRADDATINMRKKIMGDLSLECNSGHVCIDQLRGEHISLQCNNANLEVKKKLEGNLSVSCQSLIAQMVHGNSVDISADKDVNIKALYSVNSSIQSSGGSVHVNLSHGHSVINSASACSLSGVDGSFVVNNTNGGATLQINKLYPGSDSMAISRHGSISTLVDPEVVTKLYCSTRDESCISIESDGFESKVSSPTSCEGVFSGQSSAVKRPLKSSRKFARKSGKINIESAELLSLRNTTKSDSSNDSSSSSSTTTHLPSLSLIAKSAIVVESASWIGKIMKKYGM